MKAAICLEYIGEGFANVERLHSVRLTLASAGVDRGARIAEQRRPWVANIVGFSEQFGYERQFLRPTTQRQRASSTGNRGVELWFVCETGNLYQAQHYTSWKSKDQFFFIVTDHGSLQRVDETWARSRLVLMCSPPLGRG